LQQGVSLICNAGCIGMHSCSAVIAAVTIPVLLANSWQDSSQQAALVTYHRGMRSSPIGCSCETQLSLKQQPNPYML